MDKVKGIQNGYKGIDVDIISYTKHPGKIIWDMLKQTWNSLHNVDYDIRNETVNQFIQDVLDRKLNPVPLEAILIQVVFKGISRVNLAQLTRHRGWFYNSESQMPQPVNHNVIIPLNIVNSEYYDRAVKLIKESQALYNDMVKGNDKKETTNIPYQDARYLLIHGQTADISASFSLPQFLNACGMRFENNTHDEINYTFRICRKKLYDTVMSDNELDLLDKKIYKTLLDRCDVFGANNKVGTCFDAMFGNSMKRFPDANPGVTKVTEKALFNYKKLAWYAELIRMYYEEADLLLPGEKEMIESWISEDNTNE